MCRILKFLQIQQKFRFLHICCVKNLKFLYTWRNFRFLHICHVLKSEISPHDQFFLHLYIGDRGDKYEVCPFHQSDPSFDLSLPSQLIWGHVIGTHPPTLHTPLIRFLLLQHRKTDLSISYDLKIYWKENPFQLDNNCSTFSGLIHCYCTIIVVTKITND